MDRDSVRGSLDTALGQLSGSGNAAQVWPSPNVACGCADPLARGVVRQQMVSQVGA